MYNLISYLRRRPKGILDSDLASILDLKTKHINQCVKRSFVKFHDLDFGYRMTPKEFNEYKLALSEKQRWGGRRYPPIVYTFKGVCLIISRLRLNLNSTQQRTLLELFNEKNILVFDYGAGRKEEYFLERLRKIFDGITDLKTHYLIKCGDKKYSIDAYLPEYKLAIEIDEQNHKWRTKQDLNREKNIKNILQCKFIRISRNDNFDTCVNKILKDVIQHQ